MEGGESVQMEPDDEMDFKYEDFPYGTASSPTPPANDTTIDRLSQIVTTEIDHPVESHQQADEMVNVGELFVGRVEFEEMCKKFRELEEEMTRLKKTNEQNCPSKSVQTDNPHKMNARGQSLETPPKDALMTPSILTEIFSYLDLRGLKSARLVCTKWAEASSPRFLSKSRMRVCRMNIFDRAMVHFEAAFPPHSDPQHAFKSLVVDDTDIFSGMMNREWIRSYGKRLTHLQVGSRYGDKSEWFPYISPDKLRSVLKLCTNLTELVLPFPSTEYPRESDWACRSYRYTACSLRLQLLHVGDARCAKDSRNNFDFFLKMVFETLARLKTLRLESRSYVFLKKFFKWLDGSPGPKKVLEGLEELDLSYWRTSSKLMQMLAKVEFQNLKILHVGFLSWNQNASNPSTLVTNTNILDLLTAVSSTLQELTLGYPGSQPSINITLPDLPKLTKFRNSELASWGLESMDFVQKTPKLEMIELKSCKFDTPGKYYFPSITIDQKPHPQLKNLRLGCEVKAEELGLIGRCFPNLDKVVCEFWGISRFRGAMTCLNGLTSLEHLKILELGFQPYLRERPSDEDCDLKSIATALPNFPALKSLTLRSCRPLTGEMLTSGFLKCPKLKRLDLSKAEMSPEEDWGAILNSGHGMQIIVPEWVNRRVNVVNQNVNTAQRECLTTAQRECLTTADNDDSDNDGDW